MKNNPSRNLVYVETDFPEVTKTKVKIINETPKLKNLIGDVNKESNHEILCKKYNLISLDLRDSKELDKLLLEKCNLKKE